VLRFERQRISAEADPVKPSEYTQTLEEDQKFSKEQMLRRLRLHVKLSSSQIKAKPKPQSR